MIVKSKRLIITPMTKEEAEQRNWHTAWKIALKNSNVVIGEIGFKEPVKAHCVEIGYAIEKEFEGNGYTTEAVKAITERAFENEEVYFVEAETATDNKASQRVLEKNGFVPDGEGTEGTRYVKEKPDTYWMPIYMCLGLSCGLAIGNFQDNTGMGMCMGICIGMAIGAMMDSTMKKKREKMKDERNRK